MTVPGGTDKNSSVHSSELQQDAPIAGMVISAFAPACYALSWVPWLRWVGAACVVVILVITLHLITGLAILPIL